MKTLIAPLLSVFLFTGCIGTLVSIRMDVPRGAAVTLAAGVGTEALSLTTPFVGQFESGSLAREGGYPLVFDLDAASAAAYGSDRPVRVFSRLSITNPTRFARNQTLRIAPSETSLRALIRGEVSEISSFVADPNELDSPHLAEIVMRMAEF